jgi:hypothetical protein
MATLENVLCRLSRRTVTTEAAAKLIGGVDYTTPHVAMASRRMSASSCDATRGARFRSADAAA